MASRRRTSYPRGPGARSPALADAKYPFDGVWGDVLVWLRAEPDATGKALMARLQSEHPDRSTAAQLRTIQRRVKEWRGIMAKKLVCATTDEAFAELNGLPELALAGKLQRERLH